MLAWHTGKLDSFTAAGETGVVFLEMPCEGGSGLESKPSWTLDSAEGPPGLEGTGASGLTWPM